MNSNCSKRCKNCGKPGHTNKKCRLPVMSYGCIGIRVAGELLGGREVAADSRAKYEMNDRIFFTLIRRRDTISYMEFVRGKYHLNRQDMLHLLFSRMTKKEITRIAKTNGIETLWRKMWNIKEPSKKQQGELSTTCYKYNKLRQGLIDKQTGTILTLAELIEKYYPTAADTPEWGFPKGRRNLNETNKKAGIREFKEETDLKNGDFKMLPIKPLVEEYTGSNGKRYKHVYYLAQLEDRITNLKINATNHHQIFEIGDIGLFTYREAMLLIREYHTEKRAVMAELFRIISNQI